MNTTQMINEKTESCEGSIRIYAKWRDSYASVVTDLKDLIEQLPCCETDCTCLAIHLDGWMMSGDDIGPRFIVTFYPSHSDPLTPVNDIRTAVCKALGTTLAKRSFDEKTGQAKFTIAHQGIEVTIKGATIAPNCEIVSITETKEVTTFEMVCPDGEKPEKFIEALEAKEPVSSHD